jgi:acyl-CoA thioesterase FadM
LTTLDRVRLNFGYRVTKDAATAILEAETFHVCTGLNEKPKRLPEELAARLQPFLRPAE